MKAYELLSDYKNWTRKAGARDHKGVKVPVHDERATCWCMIGAIAKCYGPANIDDQGSLDRVHTQINKVKAVLMRQPFGGASPATFNDCQTHEEVLAVLKEADV